MGNVLVTGANGYLGGWLVPLLRVAGHTVVTVGARELINGNPIEIHADPFDACVHLAWYSSAGNSQLGLHQKCLDATKHVVETWRAYRPDGPFVFASTCSVYGSEGDLFEEDDDVNPQCDYTRCKAEAEQLVLGLSGGCVLRLGSLFGVGAPGGRTKTELVVNAFASDAWSNGQIQCWNPDSYKPILHVRDAAEVCLDALRWTGIVNAVYTCPRAKEIATTAAQTTGARVELQDDRPDRRSQRVSNAKLLGLGRRTFRTVAAAVEEFRDFRPVEGCRNQPWTVGA